MKCGIAITCGAGSNAFRSQPRRRPVLSDRSEYKNTNDRKKHLNILRGGLQDKKQLKRAKKEIANDAFFALPSDEEDEAGAGAEEEEEEEE
eukprot:3333760-Rhodomonas_salina.1